GRGLVQSGRRQSFRSTPGAVRARPGRQAPASHRACSAESRAGRCWVEAITGLGGERRDEVSFGPSRPPRFGVPQRPDGAYWAGLVRRHRAVSGVVALAAAAAVVVPIAVTATRPHGGPRPAASPRVVSEPGRPVTMTGVRHPLLGVRSRWELFGYGPAGLGRSQLAHWVVNPTAGFGPAG